MKSVSGTKSRHDGSGRKKLSVAQQAQQSAALSNSGNARSQQRSAGTSGKMQLKKAAQTSSVGASISSSKESMAQRLVPNAFELMMQS